MADRQYVYCIAEGREIELGAYHGLEGAPIEIVGYRGISAVVSRLGRSRVAATAHNVLLHERLVEELMGRHALLPVRFGTALPDAASVRLHLSQRFGCFVRDLDLVRGKVELGVRILAPPELPETMGAPGDAPAAPGSGTRYMMERLRQHVRARASRERLEAIAQKIQERLALHAKGHRSFAAPSGNLVMSVAYLVWRDAVAEFKGEVEAQRACSPGLHFLLTGPWPPYSFVTPVEDGSGALSRVVRVLST